MLKNSGTTRSVTRLTRVSAPVDQPCITMAFGYDYIAAILVWPLTTGVGLDWPLDYDTLRAHYDSVQSEVGLSGDAEAEVWRPDGADYPMPPLPIFAQGRVLKKGFDKTGRRTAPLPLAINSQPYQGRAACQYDGWCDAGCPIGALANPLVTWLPRAQEAGVHIEHNAFVNRVLRDPNKASRITGVEYFQAGERHSLHAQQVIIAAFTVQSARILLSSADNNRPRTRQSI